MCFEHVPLVPALAVPGDVALGRVLTRGTEDMHMEDGAAFIPVRVILIRDVIPGAILSAGSHESQRGALAD